MNNPNQIYDLILDYAHGPDLIEEIAIGLVWTFCRTTHIGLAHSPPPQAATRTLTFPGTLKGRPAQQIANWLRSWEPYTATIAMAAANTLINTHYQLPNGITLTPTTPETANLCVFDHFLPALHGKKVIVIGRYPGLEQFANLINLTVLERNYGTNDLPDPACEFLLPEADWVFLTASSIPNKTFPRLAELSKNATTVLMGPTVPWLAELHEFGIDYLAGTELLDAEKLKQTIIEGGGTKIFTDSIRYRVVPLTANHCLEWLKTDIAKTFTVKEELTKSMENWYINQPHQRFPNYLALDTANQRLSRLDSAFKKLWDQNHYKSHNPT